MDFLERIMNIIQIIGKGLLTIADAYVEPRWYGYPKTNGFQHDQDRLRNDVISVGNDLKKTIDKQHGRKQSHKFTSV